MLQNCPNVLRSLSFEGFQLEWVRSEDNSQLTCLIAFMFSFPKVSACIPARLENKQKWSWGGGGSAKSQLMAKISHELAP